MVTLNEAEVRVTYVEFEILGALARSPGRVLTRETLLEHVWGDSEYRDPRTVDVHIRHLREKLEAEPEAAGVPLHRARRRLPLPGVARATAAADQPGQPDHPDRGRDLPRHRRSSSTSTRSTIGGAASGLGAVKGQILIGGLIAVAIATALGVYYAQVAASNIRRLQDAARKVAEGNFETTIPVASVGQLGQLARTFNEMQRRLAELDSARKQFIANASHELRTPIFSLGGFVELLEDEDPSPEERAEFVRTMRQQIERLTKLTADLLDLSQLDAGAMVMQARTASTSARWPAR